MIGLGYMKTNPMPAKLPSLVKAGPCTLHCNTWLQQVLRGMCFSKSVFSSWILFDFKDYFPCSAKCSLPEYINVVQNEVLRTGKSTDDVMQVPV